MSEQTIHEAPIVATDVAFEDYLAHYAADFHEWVRGDVIKMSPVGLRHDALTYYLRQFLTTYFALRPSGRVVSAPFVMRLPNVPAGREPDLQVILQPNLPKLTDTYMDGPADICIEVVSPESVERDHVTKLAEYEQGGVGEYWLFDPLHNEARFFRLNEDRRYIRQSEDADGNYRTPKLPGLALHVPTLWQAELPNPLQIIETLKTAIKQD
jgi:Uma2 family endonuclease